MTNQTRIERILHILILLLLSVPILFAFDGFESSHAMAETVHVVVKPSNGSFFVHRHYTIEVWVEDVVDLYGADVRLSYDPKVFEVIDSNPALTGVQVQPRDEFLAPDFLVKNIADNEAGTIWYAASQSGDRHPKPVSGSGVLFQFELRVLVDGNGELEMTYSKLSNKNGEEIPTVPSGASYQINYGAMLYLPLLLSGLSFP